MCLQKTIYNHRMALLAAALVALAILLLASTTMAQSGRGYHLTTVAAPAEGNVSSGGRYTLVWIETQVSSSRNSGDGYHLALIIPAQEYDYGICLPLVVRNW